MKLNVTIAITLLITQLSLSAFAQKGTTTLAPVSADDFTCGKVQGVSLAEFKMKLVDSCDLNKPFSSSLSTVVNDNTYFYCCQKKK